MEINRALFNSILETLEPGKVNIIFGARRVGKTFLLKQICAALNEPYLWINGEETTTASLIQTREVQKYKRLVGDHTLLIIDEAQAIPQIGLALKLMVDSMPQLRILATGSSAFDLKNQLGEPLVGRAYWYAMYPIAQLELRKHENLIETKQNLHERLIYGSYPEVIQLDSFQKKERYLRDLVSAYLLKDLIQFDGIRNSNKIMDLLKLVALQCGSEVSYHELGRQLEMSKNTVEKYLDLLEKVFIVRIVRGFSRNLRKEISKSPCIYFWDNGIRNAILNNYNQLDLRTDVGALWENYILSERVKKLNYAQQYKESYFWRTYDQQEIDLIEVQNQQMEAYEIKWQQARVKTPAAFASTYPEATFSVIHQENYLEFIE
jgi:uncharacterized protein